MSDYKLTVYADQDGRVGHFSIGVHVQNHESLLRRHQKKNSKNLGSSMPRKTIYIWGSAKAA